MNKLTPELVDAINRSGIGGVKLDSQKHHYIRLEKVHMGRAGQEYFTAEATVKSIEYYGMYIKYYLAVGGSVIKEIEKNDAVEVHNVGDKVTLSIRPQDIQSFTPEPEETEPSAPKNRGKAVAAQK